jgi:DNA repair photolyase
LPCLGDIPTINITEGCAHACTYCYTQGYSGYPGPGRVILFENTAELVRSELARMRHRPRRVYFSPSSDAFQPLPEVQEVTYQTMAVLLEGDLEVAFLTKGAVGERFLLLFAKSPSRVYAQIGITTLDERLWRTFEPGAASPSQRLDTIEGLMRIGVPTKARLDPLIPDLTDTDASLSGLLFELERREVRHAAASYLFLREPFAGRLVEEMARLDEPRTPRVQWGWRSMAAGVGGGRMMDSDERRTRFSRLEALAARSGISVHVCRCKNPDLSSALGCRISGPTSRPADTPTLPLFDANQR